MIDWLRSKSSVPPLLTVGEEELPVIIRRLAQAKRMTMRLAPDGSAVKVSIPKWGTTAEALAFARSKTDWLARQRAVLPVRTALVPSTSLSFRGEVLRIEHVFEAPRRPAVSDGAIRIGGPADGIEPRLRRWLEGEARAAMSVDLVHYCARAGMPVSPLALSNARRRWGSCSGKGAIRINWRLIMAPDFVRQSVVAHEVAHLVHFDHSPRFHALLAKIYEGDLAAANRWLKQRGRELYAVL